MAKPPKPHRMPPAPCPSCGNRLSGAAHDTSRARPREGDLSVCLKCAAVLLFDGNLLPEQAPQAMLDHLQREEPDVWRELAAVRRRVLALMAAQKAPVSRA